MSRNGIDRKHGDANYRYCRMNGGDVFFTTATSGTNFNEGVADPVTRIMDHYHREVAHVVSGNYVIVFDRFKTASGFALSTTKAFVPWHTINQATENGADRAYSDSGGNRIWRRTFHKPIGTTYQNRLNNDLIYSDTSGSRSYRQEYTVPLTTGSAHMLTVMQGTLDSVLSMQAMSEVPASGIGLPLDSTMIGVTLDEAIPKHFLFSINDDGATPSTIKYYVKKTAGTDVHRVFDLVPGQEYTLFESAAPVVGSYYLYTLTPSFNVGRYANDAGVVEFTPNDIGSIGTNYYTVTVDDADATIAHSSSTISTQATFNIGVNDNAAEDREPRLFEDNFDVTSVSDLTTVGRWDGTQTPNGGTLAIEGTIVHTPGGKSLKCTVPAYAAPNIPKASIYKSIYEWGEGKELFADFWLYLATAANYNFLTFFDVEDPDYPGGLSPGFRLWFINSRVIRGSVEGETTFIEQLSANPCPQDTWVRFQVYLLLSDNPAVGRCKVWRSGALIMDWAIKTLPTGGSSQRVEVGASASNSSVGNTIYVDDLRVYATNPDRLFGSESAITAQASASSNTYYVTVADEGNPTAGSDSSLSFTMNVNINDTSGTAISSVTAERTGAPAYIDTEKRIDGPLATLVPNEDISFNFFVMEPNDGAFYSKLDDSDDSDFIRVIPLPVVQNSYAIFGLSDSSGAVSTIRSIQFSVKVKKAQFTNIDSPILRMALYKDTLDTAGLVALRDIPLYGTDDPVWARSPVIPLVINRGDIPNLKMSIRPRALSYGGSYVLEISSAFVDVSGDAVEKVI